jgi:AcrR family transcriptional regulator
MECLFQMSTSTTKHDPRSRADAVRNQQRVLEATKALLSEIGTAVTVEAISKRADVGAATVVRSFGNKEALIDVAVADLLEPIIQRARDALSEADSEMALRSFLLELLTFQSAHWIMGEQLRELDLPATTAQRAALQRSALDLVSRARDNGVIRTDIDLAIAVVLIGEATYAVARSESASAKLFESYVSVLMDGLRPQPPVGSQVHDRKL